MTVSRASYRTILRSSFIMGASTIAGILAGLVRMKAIALILGPAGVGLAGLYLSVVQFAAGVAGLGLNNVGTRQIAAAHSEGGEIAVGRIRRALFWGTVLLAVVGALTLWLASGWVAQVVFNDASQTSKVAWLSIGVALTVAAGSQTALLTGMRRVADVARINAGAGIAGAILGAVAVWIWGFAGLIAMALIAPAATFLLGHFFVAKLGPPLGKKLRYADMIAEWRTLSQLGFAFMISGVVNGLGYLIVQSLVQRESGLTSLGHFQASWAVGMTYLGFVLGAMGTDYYPRLTAIINDSESSTRLVNQQTEVAMLLCAPPLLAILGLAPWIVHLLYTSEFSPAIDILRWQLIGDVFKILSWPLGFAVLASGEGKNFMLMQTLGTGTFILITYITLPLLGAIATGIAFVGLYVCLLIVTWIWAKKRINFSWSKPTAMLALGLIMAASAVSAASRWSDVFSAVLGCLLATAMGIVALARIAELTRDGHQMGSLTRFSSKLIGLVSRASTRK